MTVDPNQPWTRHRERGHVRWMLPMAVLAVLVAAAVWLWRLEAAVQRRAQAHDRTVLVVDLADRAERAISAEFSRAAALAKAAMGVPRDQFLEGFLDAVQREIGPASLSPQHAVAWLTEHWVVDAVRAEGPEPLLTRGRNMCELHHWEAVLDRSRRERQPRVVETAVRDGRGEVVFVAPAISGEGSAAPYLGVVAARLDVGRVLSSVVRDGVRAGYDVDLTDGGTYLLRQGASISEDDSRADGRPVRVADRYLRLRLRPVEGVGRDPARAALWVLWVGLAFAVVMSWAVGHALRRRWQAVVEAERQLEAMRSLAQTAGVISAVPGAAKEALHRLAGSARQLLGMKIVTVLVLNEAGDAVDVVARAGEGDPNPRSRYPLEEARATRRCIQTGEVVVVQDVETDELVHKPVMRGHAVRSGMFVPLAVEREVIGVMFMGDAPPRVFDETEKQLARVLASQGAVALANLRLYEQKDAALVAQKELTRRHETLYQIATEIFRSEDLGASLQRLADAAPDVLGVDICTVALRTGEDETQVAAITNDFANCRGERNRASNSNVARVWQTRKPLVIDDAPNDATIHPAYAHRLHIGSIIYLPLLASNQLPIGTMMLIRHKPGSFRAEQVELAEVLAARAAEAIETARLNEEARRAAQTQQMLLRELNHRVKNNLASIVALLSMDRPPTMPSDAQAWLNRVGERIATMARTHELFVGGNDCVDLRELVKKVLPALSLIRPAGVEIRSELDQLRVELGTERAVSLAMVLNELCWNALEHGMGENGILWIRGQVLEGRRLALEVEDDGRRGGGGEAGAAANGRGTGLRLVEGLVSRELRGRFVMERTESGGTRARVEIPLEEGECEGLELGSEERT